jgi:hypothetical protein
MIARKLSFVCVSVCVLLLGVSVAYAGLLNPSFELPALAANDWTTGAWDNWNVSSEGCSLLNGNNGSGDGIFAPADGNQYIETVSYDSSATNGVWQNTGIALQPGYTYTVSAKVNRGTLTGLAGIISMQAASNTAAQGTTFASTDFSGLAASTWTTETVSAVYTGDLGKYLATTIHCGGAWAGVDSFGITTPEPSTIILLTTGLFGLLAYAWRKRK